MSAYDKAIDAYRFQVGRYHTWMKFYSLFNGALLIVVYLLVSKGSKEVLFLQLILGVVGFVAGLCWLGSIIGNRAWMNHWLKIIKKNENQVDLIYKEAIDNEQERNFLSTPVLTQVFITTVVLAWVAYILYTATLLGHGGCAFICIIVISIMSLFLYYRKQSCIHSHISSEPKR